MAGNMQDNFDENGNPIRCSFCGKEQGQVRRLVKGPTNIFICDECVAACSEILEESLASDFMDAARNGKLPGFLHDHGQAASQPATDPEAEGFELEDDRQVLGLGDRAPGGGDPRLTPSDNKPPAGRARASTHRRRAFTSPFWAAQGPRP